MNARVAAHSSRGPGRPVGEASGAGREALLAAARELIGERGLAALTSKAIAERAGLRPTLVNYYFGDRDGLLQALIAEISGDMESSILRAAAAEGTAEQKLEGVMEEMLKHFAEEPGSARLFFEQVVFADNQALDDFADRHGRSSNDALRSVLNQGVREGLFVDADIEMTVAAIGGICIFFGAATPLIQRVMNIEPLTRESAPRLARRAAALILHGLMEPGTSK
jgi:AcrR family transcriptional regulator